MFVDRIKVKHYHHRMLVQPARTPEETHRRMTQDPISRLISQLAVPTIISMLVTSFYNIADTVFVSQLGTQASGAVGIVFSLMSVIQAIGFTFGLGSGNYVSRLLGSKERETADAVFSTSFFTAFGAGLLLTIFGLSFLDAFMRVLGSTPTILPFARDYGGVILFGAPFMAASFVMNNNLRSEGNAQLGMRGIVAGAILNVALDPLLIFVLRLGIRGAAIATVISQLVSFCILLSYFLRGKSGLTLSLKRCQFRWWLYKEVLRTGMPAFYRQGMASVAIIFLNLFSAPFGDSALAAMTIVTRLMQFLGSALIGFGQGFQPVAGFNWGARYIGRLRQAYWFCIRTGFVTFLIIGSLGFAFAPAILRLFIRDDLRVVDIGSLALRLQCLVMPLQSINIITAMLFQSVGKGKQASVTALSRQGLFFVPLIATLPPIMGILGLQISQPLADIGTFFLSFLLARRFLKTLRELPQLPAAEVSSAGVISHTGL